MSRQYKPRERNINITGQKFHRWTALTKLDQPGPALWNCRCECGVERVVMQNNLRSGLSKSCGCLTKERTSESRTTHGRSRTPIYTLWLNIKARCRNPHNSDYKNYGGRGIKVCDRWHDSFEDFLADVGDKPSDVHSIDRIDVNGNYEPGNVRWATKMEQANNYRNSHQITHLGETKSINAWAKHYGFNSGALYYRIVNKGESIEEAVSYLSNSVSNE